MHSQSTGAALTTEARSETTSGDPAGIDNILCAVDFSPASHAAARTSGHGDSSSALNLKTQLIVIGVTRRTRLGSKLFGKTGKLLRDAHCPILAAPIPAIARHATDNVRKEAA